MSLRLVELSVADTPDAWRSAGFTIDDDGSCRVGAVRIRLLGPDAGSGIVGWTLSADAPHGTELDGVPTQWSNDPGGEPAVHANGALRIDHVVLLTPDVSRTLDVLAARGELPRRERAGDFGGPMRQVFFRLGGPFLEVLGPVEPADTGPARLWGLTHVVADLAATKDLLGEATGRVKDAVQPGRRITTLRHRELGMSVATALISAPPTD